MNSQNDIKIQINSWFATPVFNTQISDNFCDNLIEKVNKDKDTWEKGLENVHALTCGWDGLKKYEELETISNFVTQHILPEIGKVQKWKYNNWACIDAWINFYQKGDNAELHCHKFSDYCAVLILKPGNGNLVFVPADSVEDKYRNFYSVENQKINEKKGTLILFPDYIYHKVTDCENERISVAFNFKNNSIKE
tara:strand:+ start:12 stop:593 length:582 start_codon:yes stop_codon:yes gene_type:complete